MGHVEAGQDFQQVIDLTTKSIQLRPDHVRLLELRYATLPLPSEHFPELDNGILLDLEAEDYGAILKCDPSNETISSRKVNVDIERGDLAASRQPRQSPG